MNRASNLISRNQTNVPPNNWGIPGRIPACSVRFLTLLAVAQLSCVSARSQSLGVYAKDFVVATGSVQTIVTPAGSAAFSNYISKPAGFGSGAEGFGYHYGVSLADNVNGKLMRKLAFAAASGQREQYHPLGSGSGIWKRVAHAAMHSFIVSPGTSSRAFNWSGLPASLAASGLSNAYQPVEQRTWSATFVRFGTNSASYIAGDVWLEFTGKASQSRIFRTFLKSR